MSRAVPIADDPDNWVIPEDVKARQPKSLVEQLTEAAQKIDWTMAMGTEPVE